MATYLHYVRRLDFEKPYCDYLWTSPSTSLTEAASCSTFEYHWPRKPLATPIGTVHTDQPSQPQLWDKDQPHSKNQVLTSTNGELNVDDPTAGQSRAYDGACRDGGGR